MPVVPLGAGITDGALGLVCQTFKSPSSIRQARPLSRRTLTTIFATTVSICTRRCQSMVLTPS